MHTHVFASTEALAAEVIRLTIEAADEAIQARGTFSLALTGGSAASTLYPILAQAALPWDRVHIFFGDERCVAPDHKDSNFRLAHESFLSRVAFPKGNVHRLRGEASPDLAAREAEEDLLAVTGGALDVVHLGVGPDGHICSLFPDHPLLLEENHLV